MSSKSRQQIGWLSRFLSLLTIGRAEPQVEIAIDKESEAVQAVAMLALVAAAAQAEAANPIAEVAPAELEPAEIETATIKTANENKTLDWQSARSYRLAARLSVTAQLNRPKPVDKPIRKIKVVAAPAPRWNHSAKAMQRQANPNHDSAVVIKFPNLGNADKRLAEAA